MANIVHVSSENELDSLVAKNERKLVVLYFEAAFAAECASMNPILEQYEKDVDFTNVVIARVDAEKVEALFNKFNAEIVPSFYFMKGGKVMDSLTGFNPPSLNRLLKKCLDVNDLPTFQASSDEVKASNSLEDRLKELINKSKIMIFMKGSPDAPRCGFSRQMIEIFRETGLPYGYFDILQDETVRQGLKEFSNWPTYPQVYVNGELVGGLDIIKELKSGGELISTLNP